MRKRSLGSTGLSVSQVGFGSWPIAGSRGIPGYGLVCPELAKDTVQAALSGGISFYDTADVYGDGFAERVLGEVLEPVRNEVVICTKGGWDLTRQATNLSPDFLRKRVYASLERLRSDYIDVYLLHNPPPQLIGVRDIYRPLLALREKGVLRHIGISVAHPDEAILALDLPEVEAVQIPYNILNQDAEIGLFSHRGTSRLGVIVREALGNGLLTGKYNAQSRFAGNDFRSVLSPATLTQITSQLRQVQAYQRPGESLVDLALRFVLDRSLVSSVIVGARHPEQVAEHLKAGDIAPSPDIRAFMPVPFDVFEG